MKGRSHHLDSEKCVFEISSEVPPVLTVKPGDTVTVECKDAWNRSVSNVKDLLELDGVLPVTGPIFVEGAEPGDALEIFIEDLKPGTISMPAIFEGFGYLKEIGEPFLMKLKTEDGFVHFSEDIRIPIHPHPGFISVAPPPGQKKSSLLPGDFGGNMDCKDVTVGSTVFLPVFVPGGLIFVGDGHAVQGDGEVCVAAAECDMDVRFRVGLVKKAGIKRPRVETRDSYMTLGSGKSTDDALKEALADMIEFLQSEFGLSRNEAYVLCSLTVDMKINQVVNDLMTARAVLPKSIFLKRLGVKG